MGMTLQREIAHIWQFLKSGILTLVFYYGFYLSLNELGVWYIYSSWFASAGSSVFTFLLQKYYVFSEPKKSKTTTQVFRFFLAAIAGRILNTVALYELVEHAGFTKTTGQILLTVVTAFCAYIVFRFWIFEEK